ncbi:hypothetical protein IWX75_003204 [Arthrobacter sp. CAN_A6]|uniref:glycosyltransferase family protein n=1 Tax=Arthrobacter sp. CAN_A6 TaxID=2787721 RepID=UPI0018C94880
MIRTLADANIKVAVMFQEPLTEAEKRLFQAAYPDVVIHHPPVSRVPPERRVRRFAWEAAVYAKEAAASIVISRGIELSRALLGNEGTAPIVWPLLPTSELAGHLSEGKPAQQLLAAITDHASHVLVESEKVRKNLVALVPAAGGRRIFSLSVPEDFSATPWTENLSENFVILSLLQLHNMIQAERRVLIFGQVSSLKSGVVEGSYASTDYRSISNIASPTDHVIFFVGDGADDDLIVDNLKLSPYVTVITPSPAAHQIEAGGIIPRFAVWHILLSANQLNCDVIICGDLEVGYLAIKNKIMQAKLWQALLFDSIDALKIIQEPRLDELIASARRLVVAKEDHRSILEARFPDATAKTLVLSGLLNSDHSIEPLGVQKNLDRRAFQQNLKRFLPDYRESPRLGRKKKMVIAGHDFKFAGELIEILSQRDDFELQVDAWRQQNIQDESRSETLLNWADMIFCEFCSLNAVWYSWSKKPGQTLIVRFHGYELNSEWIRDINVANVDMFVFVSEFYRDQVVSALKWPVEKTTVIPNMVDVQDLHRPKLELARFHIGIIGVVPILKRPDRALDLLEILLESDLRYTLHVRGRAPWQYQWMWSNDHARDAYESFYERLASNPKLRRRVVFEEFGPDMGRWLQKIGWVLSPSFRETFHLAPVEGMASGAVPVVWKRDGAAEIFSSQWVHQSAMDAACYIIEQNETLDAYHEASQSALSQVDQFDVQKVGRRWLELLLDAGNSYSATPSASITAERMEETFRRSSTATHFERLIRVLVRDKDFPRVDALVRENSTMVETLPSALFRGTMWRQGLSILKRGGILIPERSNGPVYLQCPDRVLYAMDLGTTQEKFKEAAPLRDQAHGSYNLRHVSVSAPTLNFDVDLEVQELGVRTVVVAGDEEYAYLPLRNVDRLSLDRQIMAAADAFVREARIFRPTVMRSQRDYWVALPALIAARRLGIPFVCDMTQQYKNACETDIDSMITAAVDAHCLPGERSGEYVVKALNHQNEMLRSSSARRLEELRVGVIADQFTSRTIEHSFHAFPLSRKDGFIEVATLDLDAVFVESAWEGPNDEWRRGVAYYPELIEDLERIVMVARKLAIPVIFWNKEDPVHYRAFARTAALMDHIFTTDADMVGNYLAIEKSENRTVSASSFYAEPMLHNPLPTDRIYEHSVSYAGTYYGARFKERSSELDGMLRAASNHGLTIYDRQLKVPNSPYEFPEELRKYVREGVDYDEVLKVYKAHPININVNSANNSPTMFSRRVVEVAASGALVLSGEGRGIIEQFEAIEASNSPERWNSLLESWMSSASARTRDSWAQMRSITRAHLAEHSLTLMFRTAGINISARTLPLYVLDAGDRTVDAATAEILVAQTWRPHAIIANSIEKDAGLLLKYAGISISTERDAYEADQTWIGPLGKVSSSSYYEDLLHATRFGTWNYLTARHRHTGDGQQVILLELANTGTLPFLKLLSQCAPEAFSPLTWIVPEDDETQE